MPIFVARIVLNDADRLDYEALHQLMAWQGFNRTITGTNGQVHELPDAEYSCDSTATLDQVFEKARAAAARTKLKYAVVVSQISSCKWTGLKRVA